MQFKNNIIFIRAYNNVNYFTFKQMNIRLVAYHNTSIKDKTLL